jgi:geranylgeranyl transferase type-1 subunit beta
MSDDNELIERRHEKCYKYFRHTLLILPASILVLDNSKVLLAYFAISGMDIMNKLDKLPHSKDDLINWIYMHQITESLDQIDSTRVCGFRGSTTLLTRGNNNTKKQNHFYDCSHVTMTFSALNALVTLGDDLSRVNKRSVLTSLKRLQLADGSFTATFDNSENDIRFLYSACCICFILNDWDGVDKKRAVDFIINCLTYEGAFGQNPGAEAHGGSTFCAVASLFLMDKLNILNKNDIDKLTLWCLNRQTTGFNGRVNKPWDTCYSFWIGSTLNVKCFYLKKNGIILKCLII